LPRLSWKLLKNNGIDMTPDELREAFAEGQKLIVGERIRPVAAQKLDGNWEVHLVGYSPLSEPAAPGAAVWDRAGCGKRPAYRI
jgi:hypothetical protein